MGYVLLGAARALSSYTLAGFCAALMIAAQAHAVTIEIDDVAPDRVERQRAFAEGALPLANTPNLGQFDARLAAKGLKSGDEMFVRIFKAESELEVWMRKGDTFVLFAQYPICHWAGTLGPKLKEGDRQNPEGFYAVGRHQLHRGGRWPRSLNIGFPNTFDRSHGRTGSYLLVHGGCSSVGCYAMTNAVMAEIYTLTEQALQKGQPHVEIHIFPFRMTAANLAAHGDNPWIEFWRDLKKGYDAFEQSHVPPRIGLCEQRYVIEAAAPGEVGDKRPLASCGAVSAAPIESSSPSFAVQSRRLLPWSVRSRLGRQAHNPGLYRWLRWREDRLKARRPRVTMGRKLDQQKMVRRETMARRKSGKRLARETASRQHLEPGKVRAAGTTVARTSKLAARREAGAARKRPPCNLALASCRKYFAMRSPDKSSRASLAGRRSLGRGAPATRRPAGAAKRVVARRRR